MNLRTEPPAGFIAVLVLALAFATAGGCSTDRGQSLLGPSASPSTSALESALPGPTTAARGNENPPFDRKNFVTGVNHPFFPLVPGTSFTYLEAEGEERILVEVLETPKDILGIAATVVRDRVYVGNDLVEDTHDWFAQDKDGNVWYLGEDVKNYENGMLVSTDGSWEAGVNDAQAGINMLAEPDAGDTYFQEHAPGVAEDMARVKRLDVDVSVPYGDFAGSLQIVEWTPLEPGSKGYKFYARGVGLVLESSTGDRGRVELVSVTHP